MPPRNLFRTFYQLLGVSDNASDRQIQKAHTALAKIWHTDKIIRAKWLNDSDKKFVSIIAKELGRAKAGLTTPPNQEPQGTIDRGHVKPQNDKAKYDSLLSLYKQKIKRVPCKNAENFSFSTTDQETLNKLKKHLPNNPKKFYDRFDKLTIQYQLYQQKLEQHLQRTREQYETNQRDGHSTAATGISSMDRLKSTSNKTLKTALAEARNNFTIDIAKLEREAKLELNNKRRALSFPSFTNTASEHSPFAGMENFFGSSSSYSGFARSSAYGGQSERPSANAGVPPTGFGRPSWSSSSGIPNKKPSANAGVPPTEFERPWWSSSSGIPNKKPSANAGVPPAGFGQPSWSSSSRRGNGAEYTTKSPYEQPYKDFFSNERPKGKPKIANLVKIYQYCRCHSGSLRFILDLATIFEFSDERNLQIFKQDLPIIFRLYKQNILNINGRHVLVIGEERPQNIDTNITILKELKEKFNLQNVQIEAWEDDNSADNPYFNQSIFKNNSNNKFLHNKLSSSKSNNASSQGHSRASATSSSSSGNHTSREEAHPSPSEARRFDPQLDFSAITKMAKYKISGNVGNTYFDGQHALLLQLGSSRMTNTDFLSNYREHITKQCEDDGIKYFAQGVDIIIIAFNLIGTEGESARDNLYASIIKHPSISTTIEEFNCSVEIDGSMIHAPASRHQLVNAFRELTDPTAPVIPDFSDITISVNYCGFGRIKGKYCHQPVLIFQFSRCKKNIEKFVSDFSRYFQAKEIDIQVKLICNDQDYLFMVKESSGDINYHQTIIDGPINMAIKYSNPKLEYKERDIILHEKLFTDSAVDALVNDFHENFPLSPQQRTGFGRS